jgi:hypothetical protein
MTIYKRELPKAQSHGIDCFVEVRRGMKGALGKAHSPAKPRFELARNSAHSGCESLDSQRFLQQTRYYSLDML